MRKHFIVKSYRMSFAIILRFACIKILDMVDYGSELWLKWGYSLIVVIA
jgi:hypothetical protein